MCETGGQPERGMEATVRSKSLFLSPHFFMGMIYINTPLRVAVRMS